MLLAVRAAVEGFLHFLARLLKMTEGLFDLSFEFETLVIGGAVANMHISRPGMGRTTRRGSTEGEVVGFDAGRHGETEHAARRGGAREQRVQLRNPTDMQRCERLPVEGYTNGSLSAHH